MGTSTDSNIQITVTHEFNSPAEKVFDAWLSPDSVRKWWGLIDTAFGQLDVRRVEIDAKVGGRYTFSDMRPEGEVTHWGTYKVIDRPNKLVFTFFTSDEEELENNSLVTLTFTPTTNGCRVDLHYDMDAKWAEYIAQTENGWKQMLLAIEKLEGTLIT